MGPFVVYNSFETGLIKWDRFNNALATCTEIMMFYFGRAQCSKTQIHVVITALMKYERVSNTRLGPPFGLMSKTTIVMDGRILFVVMFIYG